MRTIVFSILLILCAPGFASERNEKVRVLMDAQGLLKMFQAQMDAGKEETRNQAKQMFDQMLAGMSPSKEFKLRFQRASEGFIDSLTTPWTAEDVVKEWANAYAKDFSDKELDQLLAYYLSPLGRKEVAAAERAMPILNAYFSERAKPVIERSTKKYIEDLQLIAKECNCRK